MNNTQFRRLVLDTPSKNDNSLSSSSGSALSAGPGATPSALGSRARSSIPMTPRSVANSTGTDFARQLAERDAALSGAGASSSKRFRSSAAPKGTKLASGYQDRTQLRTSAEEDDKAGRVKALEEMVKLGQMEWGVFEALRDEIVGGDVENVHLVKGLDRRLLERVRRGEDVLGGSGKLGGRNEQVGKEEDVHMSPQASVDVDDELEKLEEREVKPLERDEKKKKKQQGEMAPPPLPPLSLAGRKRNRDEILKEMKAARLMRMEEEKKVQQPSLGPKFRKLGHKQEQSRIEKDERGREVLITVDEDGRVKRKVKRLKVEEGSNVGNGLLMPDKEAKPLGMDVSTFTTPALPAEEEDDDIFTGVGNDYNPLGDIDEDDDEGDSETDDQLDPRPARKPQPPENRESSSPPVRSEDLPSQETLKSLPDTTRNYFDSPHNADIDRDIATPNPLNDPNILAALKKASTIAREPSNSTDDPEEARRLNRRRKLLESHDRDAEDMDMEFGSSRFEDQEDGEERRVKLSVWGGKDVDVDGRGRSEKRKRGPKTKRKKGDGENMKDVLGVLERRKKEAET